jgi:hypothetical protein
MALHVEMAAPQQKYRVSFVIILNNLWQYCRGDIKQDLGMTLNAEVKEWHQMPMDDNEAVMQMGNKLEKSFFTQTMKIHLPSWSAAADATYNCVPVCEETFGYEILQTAVISDYE